MLHCALQNVVGCITKLPPDIVQFYFAQHHYVAKTCNTSGETHNNAFQLAKS